MSLYLSKDEVEELLAIDVENITLTQLRSLFADTKDKKKRFDTFDKFILPENTIGNNKRVETTVGRYIFNGFALAKLHNFIDYYNDTLTQKNMNKLIDKVAKLLIVDKITTEIFMDFFNRHQWLGFSISNFLCPSLNVEEMPCPPKTAKLRDELFAKYAKEIANCDVKVISDIEKQLLDSAMKEIKGTDIEALFLSGARGKESNYMKMILMTGLINKLSEQGFYVSKANLLDGFDPEDQYKFSNLSVEGAVGRAVDTQKFGYLAKQMNSAFQGADIDEEGTDCGTKLTLKVKVNEFNMEKLLYSYIVENGKLVCLTPEIIKNYLGKVVNKRSPMYCKTDKICEKCFGKLPYMIGIKKIGLIVSQIQERMKNMSMKKFHDASVKLSQFDIGDYFKEVR